MSRPHRISYTLTRGDEEIELDVEYSLAPFYPVVMPSFNDPGSPAEGGQVEDLEVTRNGAPFVLTDGEIASLETHIHETLDYSEDDDFDL